MEHSTFEQAMRALDESEREILELIRLRREVATRLALASMMPGRRLVLEERVSDVVSRLRLRNAGPLDDAALTQLFQAIIQATEPLFSRLSGDMQGEKRVDIRHMLF